MVQFHDALTLNAPRRTKDGYYAVRARSARTGVYKYLGSETDPDNAHGLRDIGLVNDGGGAIHTKFGFMWELVNALDDAGYTLGTDLFYDNFVISGAQSTALVTSGAPSEWTNAAVALAPDLIVMHMGMNEYNSATTEASMIIAINAAKAAGIGCLVMGVELRNTSQSVVGWELTNRSLHPAAEFTGVAFISTLPLYDPRFPGALGVAAADRCAANRINHPGIKEHAAIDRDLIKTVME